MSIRMIALTTLAISGLTLPLVTPALAHNHSEAQSGAMDKMTISGAWDAALAQYVKAPDADGVARFDYGALQDNSADRQALTDYIKHLSEQAPSTMEASDATAYWANLYNALTINVVIDNYPVTSIKKIKSGIFTPGPWKRDLVTVEGKTLSLDDIEHGILRVDYASPLIHYMVNCASLGCPNLKDGLWKADTLDADRDMAARAFINGPHGVKIKGDDLKVSSIYEWFKDDFGGDDAGVIAHLSEYAEAELKSAIDAGAQIKGHDYNWSLNDTK